MSTLTLRRLIAGITFSFICAASAHGQTPQTTTWEDLQSQIALGQKVDVVTIAAPTQRQTCLVRSIDANEIACTHRRHTTIFRAGDVAALIEPGVHRNYYFDFLAAGLGSILAAGLFALVCPVCAAVAAVAAVGFFVAAPLSTIHWHRGSGETLLFLAPGQTLQVRLS